MTISAITTVSSSSSASSTVSSSSTTSSSDLELDFIDLLVAQIKNQDPTSSDTTDSSQYISELSQLSMVQSLQSLETLQTTSNTDVEDLKALQSTNLVGQEVLVKTDTTKLTSDGTLSGQVTLSSSADSMTVYVYDSSGSLVTSETTASPTSGSYDFAFDDMSAGTYTVTVKSTSGTTTTTQTPYLYSTVESVTLNSSGTTLQLSGTDSVSLDDVVGVSKS